MMETENGAQDMDTEINSNSSFTFDSPDDATDNDLAALALSGDKQALETLLARHQPWIYNLAFRMVMVQQDAQDITQEILIKLMTKLSTFDPAKASLTTWLYRIGVNHVINMKKRNYEAAITNIQDYYSFVSQVPDEDPDNSPETQLVIKDIGIGCVTGVMLCLEREQRVAFILAIAFNVSDAQGSEILDISKDAFRQLLSRARKKLHQHMNGNCGLVNPEAPCQCRKKVKGFMKSGSYGPDRLTFAQEEAPKVKDVIGKASSDFDREIYQDYRALLQEHPFYQAPEVTEWLKELVGSKRIEEIFGSN